MGALLPPSHWQLLQKANGLHFFVHPDEPEGRAWLHGIEALVTLGESVLEGTDPGEARSNWIEVGREVDSGWLLVLDPATGAYAHVEPISIDVAEFEQGLIGNSCDELVDFLRSYIMGEKEGDESS